MSEKEGKEWLESEEGQAQFNSWLREAYQSMGQYAFSQGVIGEDSGGKVVWAVPFRILLGRVWDKAARDKAYWVITGGDVPADHVEANVAGDARSAARHFALKWQLEGARVSSLSGTSAGDVGQDADWQSAGDRLAQQAELLYELVERDDLWAQAGG